MAAIERKHLGEVTLMRVCLIVLLVFYHAFVVYNGHWEPPAGFRPIMAYNILDKLSYAFLLESFVFISGYVWSFQLQRGRPFSFWKLAGKKFSRLIIPALLFGVPYYFLFMHTAGTSGWEVVRTILEGAGHLWFLPMLFWCFIITALVFLAFQKDGTRMVYILPFLALLSVASSVNLPMRWNLTMYYLFFFVAGFCFYPRAETIGNRIDRKMVVFLWMLFVAVFIPFTLLSVRLHLSDASGMGRWTSFGIDCLDNLLRVVTSLVGIAAFYSTAYLRAGKESLAPRLIRIGSYCFGVYIFQQFFLKGMYYKTALPKSLGPVWLPWVGFLVALVLSLALSFLLRLTSFGRKLI